MTSHKDVPETQARRRIFCGLQAADQCGISIWADKMTCFRTRDLSGLSACGSLDAV